MMKITTHFEDTDNPMITAGSCPPIGIDFGRDEPGMVLQFRDVEGGYIVWRDYAVDVQ